MRVHAIQTGTVRVHARQRSGQGHGLARFARTLLDREWTERLPIHAWAIEHPEGVIVVDSGDTARVAEPGYLPAWHPYFRFAVRLDVSPEEEIGPRLRALGIAPADVRWLVLTHLHTDHAGGLAHFPESEILLAREEYQAARGTMGKLRGFLPQRWPAWFAPHALRWAPEPVGPFPESHAVTRAGDVRVVRTTGHTAGHVSVVADDGDGTLIFLAGDASYTEENMLAGVVDGVSSMGGGEEAAAASLARIRQLASTRRVVYLPSHDPQSAARLAERSVVAERVRERPDAGAPRS
jgi:glyoxylase-like metal-dependent hydrolase (beta-lactamase superfamily II)